MIEFQGYTIEKSKGLFTVRDKNDDAIATLKSLTLARKYVRGLK